MICLNSPYSSCCILLVPISPGSMYSYANGGSLTVVLNLSDRSISAFLDADGFKVEDRMPWSAKISFRSADALRELSAVRACIWSSFYVVLYLSWTISFMLRSVSCCTESVLFRVSYAALFKACSCCFQQLYTVFTSCFLALAKSLSSLMYGCLSF